MLFGLLLGDDRFGGQGTAVEVMGPSAVAASLPMLQPLALPRPVRQRLSGDKALLDRLSETVLQRTGAEPVELDQLQRLQPRAGFRVVRPLLQHPAVFPRGELGFALPGMTPGFAQRSVNGKKHG